MKATSRRAIAYQQRKRALGLCIRCGSKPAVTKDYCEDCRQKRNRAKREKKKNKDLKRGPYQCGNCGDRTDRHNAASCQEQFGARADDGIEREKNHGEGR